jgi:translation initiation factor IF-1
VPRIPGDREVRGIVAAQLPKALYRVTLETGHEVTAHLSSDMRRNFIRILAGDRMIVALSPRDLRRGRIVERL